LPNVGIKFHTPKEFFLGEEICQDFKWGGLDVGAFVSINDGAEIT